MLKNNFKVLFLCFLSFLSAWVYSSYFTESLSDKAFQDFIAEKSMNGEFYLTLRTNAELISESSWNKVPELTVSDYYLMQRILGLILQSKVSPDAQGKNLFFSLHLADNKHSYFLNLKEEAYKMNMPLKILSNLLRNN